MGIPPHSTAGDRERVQPASSARTNLIAVMSALPSIEGWRSNLTETQRLRLSQSAVLKNYRKAFAIKPAPKSVISPKRRAADTITRAWFAMGSLEHP